MGVQQGRDVPSACVGLCRYRSSHITREAGGGVNAMTHFRWFSTPLARASEVFPRLMMAISVIAGLAHLSFIFLFDSVSVGAMARANIASVLVYALTALLTQQGHARLALQIMAVEILLHGSVATALIGWTSGFHCYLCLLYTSPSPRDKRQSRMPSSA